MSAGAALCKKDWHYRNPHAGFFKEKSLSGKKLQTLLSSMTVVVDDTID
jgi:hypothetical protein